jgi:metallophosphoesterase (TIGR00282 family)
MVILCIGDVVSEPGCAFLREKLPGVKRFYGADLCIVNGENSAAGNGITKKSLDSLYISGADIVTTGNHALRRRDSLDLFDESENLLRPYNYHKSLPGKGFLVYDMGKRSVMVANLAGNAFMDRAADPFTAADEILSLTTERVKIKIFDFHAEVTSEKTAMALYLDGRASVLFGTHTHVQTADEIVYPKGLGYITDLGMTGPSFSVLGLSPEGITKKFITGVGDPFEVSKNPVEMCGAVFEVCETSGICKCVQRISIK